MGKFYSNALKLFFLPTGDRIMKTTISSWYRTIARLQNYSPDAVKDWQNKRLRKLVHHAWSHSTYYKKLFRNDGLGPEDIRTQDDLSKLPNLTKEDIRLNFTEMVASNIASIPHQKSSTGGSTGDPLIYLLDNQSWSYTSANSIFNWERTGYRYGDPYVALGSTSLFVDKRPSLKHRIYYRLKNKIGLNGINMSNQVCSDYVELIRKKEIRFLYGYASSIYLLAKYVKAHNQDLSIDACFPTSEVLITQFRNMIQEAFHCKIVDSYGANDGGVSAFSFERGFFEVGYNCLVRVESPDRKGLGPALLTDLLNYAMPLINYKLGDDIQINAKQNGNYPYNGQILNSVLGRSSDIIELENGRKLTGPGFTILFKDLPVEHYCIGKIGKNLIKCKIVKLSGYDERHENLIRETLKKQMGEDTKLIIDYTDIIPLSMTGKRIYFMKETDWE